MKTCSKCGEEKPLDGFYARKGSSDGFRNDCKKCLRKRTADYAKSNPEKVKKTKALWREKNQDLLREKRRVWFQEKGKAVAYEWRRANPEKIKKYRRDFLERHGERVRAAQRAHYHENKKMYAIKQREWLDKKYGAEKLAELARKRTPEYRVASENRQREKSKLFKRLRVAEISNEYVRHLLNGIGVKNPPQELIELKRVQLMIHREINRGSKL